MMERQADFFGLQYMYKAGYDPTSFVDFFEKIETLEKKKPGSVSKLFSTHPMTDDRITAAQAEIQKILPARPEYVVNTSEFNDMKARLAMLHNHRKIDNEDLNRPRLRRAPGSGTGTASDRGQQTDCDDRPTFETPSGRSVEFSEFRLAQTFTTWDLAKQCPVAGRPNLDEWRRMEDVRPEVRLSLRVEDAWEEQ
ncbi:MAG: M48 family metalloprotease [Acidobacteriia bacterium]|nr:M48 family metalloprotease [Terriglobia bacterium]